MNNKRKRPLTNGIRIAIGAILLQLVAWGAQTISVIGWETSVSMGLQTERFTGSEIERVQAQLDWGIAAADIVLPLPLAIIALIGILRRRPYGFGAGLMELSIGAYWPIVFAFQRWNEYPGTASIAVGVWTVSALFGIVFLWRSHSFFGFTDPNAINGHRDDLYVSR